MNYYQGLCEIEAKQRLEKYGKNEISKKEISVLKLFFSQLFSPFNLMLFVASILSFVFHDVITGGFVLGFVFLGALLSFYQEYKSEKILSILTTFFTHPVFVFRDGVLVEKESSQLVLGDVVSLQSGNIIPADVEFLETDQCFVDESMLTGESYPVEKNMDQQEKMVGYCGTHLLKGGAIVRVLKTGNKTRLGEIGKLSAKTHSLGSFEKDMRSFSVFIIRLTLVSTLVVFVFHGLFSRDTISFLDLFVFSIALAVAVIPEGLPVVMTFALSKGAHLMKEKQVVVKRLSAIEDLGSIDVLCTDKTGTLTENSLCVDSFFGNEELFLSYASSFFKNEHIQKGMEKFSFLHALSKYSNVFEKRNLNLTILEYLPFDPQTKIQSMSFQTLSGNQKIEFGAPETIFLNVNSQDTENANQWFEHESKKGNRVIAMSLEKDDQVQLVGLVSFGDPLKFSSKETIKKAKELGIEIVILTGDHKHVATHVGFQSHLIESENQVMNAEDFFELNEKEQREKIKGIRIFSRTSPEQKLAIIHLLKSLGNRVGFLGDGMNDAPALKEAHVGLVVKETHDIAREAADVVLLNQDLKVVIDGIIEGRKIFANTMKYIRITLSSNLGNFYSMVIASFFIDFLPMLPIQLLFVNLLTDFPMIAVASDSVSDVDLKKPSNYSTKEVARSTAYFGFVSSVFDFATFFLFLPFGGYVLQTAWFLESIFSELFAIFILRSRQSIFHSVSISKSLLTIFFLASFLTISIVLVPSFRSWFSFVSLSLFDWLIVVGILIGFIFAMEFAKRKYYDWFFSDDERTPRLL